MHEPFVLIPGRSSRQGVALNQGKYTDDYLDETSTLRMHPDDMQRLGLSGGDRVRMWNDVGNVTVPVIDAGDECPLGLVFMCYGGKSSLLMGGETHGSGMPDSKGLDVLIEKSPPSDSETEAESAGKHDQSAMNDVATEPATDHAAASGAAGTRAGGANRPLAPAAGRPQRFGPPNAAGSDVQPVSGAQIAIGLLGLLTLLLLLILSAV